MTKEQAVEEFLNGVETHVPSLVSIGIEVKKTIDNYHNLELTPSRQIIHNIRQTSSTASRRARSTLGLFADAFALPEDHTARHTQSSQQNSGAAAEESNHSDPGFLDANRQTCGQQLSSSELKAHHRQSRKNRNETQEDRTSAHPILEFSEDGHLPGGSYGGESESSDSGTDIDADDQEPKNSI